MNDLRLSKWNFLIMNFVKFVALEMIINFGLNN